MHADCAFCGSPGALIHVRADDRAWLDSPGDEYAHDLGFEERCALEQFKRALARALEAEGGGVSDAVDSALATDAGFGPYRWRGVLRAVCESRELRPVRHRRNRDGPVYPLQSAA